MDEARLAAIPLFASLSKSDREQLSSHATEIDIPEGTKLVREGAFSYEFFVIEQGRAQVSRGDHDIAELGPGDFMGEMGLLGGVQRNATVTALTQMSVIVMSGPEFRHVSRMLPEVAAQIRSACAQRAELLETAG
jgi:voltage-gated potassium channel